MIHGAMASLVTPFRSDSGLDVDAITSFSNRVASTGFDVVCFAGGTGEFLSMDAEERETGLKAVIDGAEGKPVLAAALLTERKEILQASARYATIGASAIMVIPPYFYAMDQNAMFEHLSEIADKSALPVLLFNSSARGGKTMSLSTILRLAEACPNIIGVKETTEDMNSIGALAQGTRESFCVIQAHEPLILPSYALGANGSFGSLCNLMPKTVVALHRAIERREVLEARRLSNVLSDVAEVAYSVTIPVGIKYLMNRLGIHQGGVRTPLSMSSLDDNAKKRLDLVAMNISQSEATI